MEVQWFDRIVRTFGQDGISRRRAVKALIAGVGGSVAVIRATQPASAASCKAFWYKQCCENTYYLGPCSGKYGTAYARENCRSYAVGYCQD